MRGCASQREGGGGRMLKGNFCIFDKTCLKMGPDLVGKLGDDHMDMEHTVLEGRCMWKNLVG